ncbi:MAG: hypothetical protein PARBA_03710 [Parabacteroides sp.]
MKVVKLFVALLLAMVCIGLSSCNKDKDNDEGDYVSSALVGTWKCPFDSEEEWFVFKADGTGYTWDVWEGKSSSKCPITYVFNEKTSILTIAYDEDDVESDSAEVVLLTDKKLILHYNGEEDTITYYRQ